MASSSKVSLSAVLREGGRGGEGRGGEGRGGEGRGGEGRGGEGEGGRERATNLYKYMTYIVNNQEKIHTCTRTLYMCMQGGMCV